MAGIKTKCHRWFVVLAVKQDLIQDRIVFSRGLFENHVFGTPQHDPANMAAILFVQHAAGACKLVNRCTTETNAVDLGSADRTAADTACRVRLNTEA